MSDLKKAYMHFRTIGKHRRIVRRLMCKCGYLWQGMIHDISKYSAAEFLPSARYFQGNKSPIETEKARIGYSAAWMHHKGHNPHHWEYWIDFNSGGEVIANRIPYRYVVEMMCDYVAAGMVYNKEQWTQDDPIKYFEATLHGRHYHPETERLLRVLFTEISKRGVEKTCELVRSRFYGYNT